MDKIKKNIKIKDSPKHLIESTNSRFQEIVMLSRRVNKHEKWIQQIADKLGVKLEY